MSVENNNFMSTLKKNKLAIGIVVVIIIGIILFLKVRGSEEAFSPSSSEHIVENFPQSTPMNVMYSDASGNLGTTTDLGLQNLTISSDGAMLLGNKFRLNGGKDAWKDDEWLRMMNKENTGYYGGFATGKLYADGTIGAGSTISTSTGYGVIDNRNVKPNQLAGGHVQFGFGSLTNNGNSPWADTIHLNGWGDSSGGNPNLVMFDKSKPGMRIYQGNWNSEAYTTYKDAVMADSGGNASVGGNLNVNGKVLEKGHALIPYGMIMMWSGDLSEIPAGWRLCNGGNGTPNLVDRFIVGAGSGYGVGVTGGANEVTLLKRHMPRHSHKSANTSNKIAGQGWAIQVAGGNQNSIDTNGVITSFNDLISEEGEDIPHENRPPFYALCYIMKV
jgi:hypothetical protein